MLPFNKFKVLVKCLRDTKVKLISRRDDHRACEEYVSYLAESIREMLAIILSSSKHLVFSQMALKLGRQASRKS